VTTAPAIEIVDLVKRFGSFAAVDGLSLSVDRGEIHGFLGPNGAGKSTAIRVLLGLYRATSGHVRVLGRDPGTAAADVTRRVSYVPGEVALWPRLTGQEVLDALAGLRGAYDSAAERELVEEFGLDPSREVRTYSKGNRQKVVLVAALAARTDVLVLDEPTSGLDPLMEVVFRRRVRRAADEGRTVLLSSHVLAEVEQLCEAVTIIKDGRLVESGRLAELRHLAASVVGARVAGAAMPVVAAQLQALGLHPASPSSPLRVNVPREHVPVVLQLLLHAGAEDITCAPASLEDLFLRHYAVAAR
jgi:ABC-2 type transport system ATP-binding protein